MLNRRIESFVTESVGVSHPGNCYPEAGIPVYEIVNLKEKNIEVYLQPLPDKSKYNQSTGFHLDQVCEGPISDVGTLAFHSQEVF